MAKPLLMLSTILAQLQALYAEHGDLPVLLDDPDTHWPMVPDIAFVSPPSWTSDEWYAIGDCVTISGGYGDSHAPVLPPRAGVEAS